MKSAEIQVGGVYLAKVGNRVVPVNVLGTFAWTSNKPNQRYGGIRELAYHTGWIVVNTVTGREIRVRSAQRFRGAVTTTEAVQ
jgi:hypothetical protein